jgi:hypothetical protein
MTTVNKTNTQGRNTMTRNVDKVWEDIKNSHLNIGTTTSPVRLNYWDGRDLFEGEQVSANFVTVDAADVSETQLHFKENGHYGSRYRLLGGKYLLGYEAAYANAGSVGYGQLHDTDTVLDTSGYILTSDGHTYMVRDADSHMSTLAICGGIIAFTDDGLFQAWRYNLNDEYKRIVDEAERTVGEYLGEEMTILTFPDNRQYARDEDDEDSERPSGVLARIRAWWARA